MGHVPPFEQHSSFRRLLAARNALYRWSNLAPINKITIFHPPPERSHLRGRAHEEAEVKEQGGGDARLGR